MIVPTAYVCEHYTCKQPVNDVVRTGESATKLTGLQDWAGFRGDPIDSNSSQRYI